MNRKPNKVPMLPVDRVRQRLQARDGKVFCPPGMRARRVEVDVEIATETSSRVVKNTFSVPPRQNPDSNAVRTRLCAEAIEKATKAYSALGNGLKISLRDYRILR